MNALAISDLRMLSGEPRVYDERLGEVLGFDRPRNIRKIIRRNIKELRHHGEVCSTAEQTSPLGGRPAQAFHLNEAQAIRVTMWSRTNEAHLAQRQIVEVFMAWRRRHRAPSRSSIGRAWRQFDAVRAAR